MIQRLTPRCKSHLLRVSYGTKTRSTRRRLEPAYQSVRMIASLWSTPIFSPLNILDHSSRTRMRPARYRMERGSHLTRESKHV